MLLLQSILYQCGHRIITFVIGKYILDYLFDGVLVYLAAASFLLFSFIVFCYIAFGWFEAERKSFVCPTKFLKIYYFS